MALVPYSHHSTTSPCLAFLVALCGYGRERITPPPSRLGAIVHGREHIFDHAVALAGRGLQFFSIDDGEVVLYWDLPAKQAAKLLKLLRNDLINLDADEFIPTWGGLDLEDLL